MKRPTIGGIRRRIGTPPSSVPTSSAILRLRADVEAELASTTDPIRIGFLSTLLSRGSWFPSQLLQDVFALSTCPDRPGYFCEFGASDGISLSNTWRLESQFGWTGLLCEPGRVWHERLTANRPRSVLELRCIWSSTGERLPFAEAPEPELSTIASFQGADRHADRRSGPSQYEVDTVSLVDALTDAGAPASVDYLSIDTEGSEFEILRHHDFDRFRFGAITVEHNYANTRELIRELLEGHGYTRVLVDWSLWDDWYIDARRG